MKIFTCVGKSRKACKSRNKRQNGSDFHQHIEYLGIAVTTLDLDLIKRRIESSSKLRGAGK